MKLRAALISYATGLLVAMAALAAVPADRYIQGTPSADGIGKRYQGREIAHVMGWQAAQWLEREEREQEERTSLLVDELNLKPGMVVADVARAAAISAAAWRRWSGQGA
jgi:hypothetical protein